VAVLLSSSLFSIKVQAGTYSGGTGGSAEPYRIASAKDLNDIGNNPEDFDKHFVLVNDVDLAGYTGMEFNIIGSQENPFGGVFDGNGHTISSFSYNSDGADYIGLFAVVYEPNALIKDLTLAEPNVSAGTDGFVGSLVGSLYGTVHNCRAAGVTVSGWANAGGLVGENWGDIVESSATGSVSGTYSVGGLVGDNYGQIADCSSGATVSGDDYIGGLVGGNGYGHISYSSATGDVTGNDCVGGLVGYSGSFDAATTIVNSYAMGEVLGVRAVGGLVGDNDGTILECYSAGSVSGGQDVGGLAGENGQYWEYRPGYPIYVYGNVYDSYSAGWVSGPGPGVGGLIGTNVCGEVLHSFWDIESSGQPSSQGGQGKTTARMYKEATFTDAGWDLIDIWNIGESQTYPYLRAYSAGDINHDRSVDFRDVAIIGARWLDGF
jgi:hypothetical protein